MEDIVTVANSVIMMHVRLLLWWWCLWWWLWGHSAEHTCHHALEPCWKGMQPNTTLTPGMLVKQMLRLVAQRATQSVEWKSGQDKGFQLKRRRARTTVSFEILVNQAFLIFQRDVDEKTLKRKAGHEPTNNLASEPIRRCYYWHEMKAPCTTKLPLDLMRLNVSSPHIQTVRLQPEHVSMPRIIKGSQVHMHGHPVVATAKKRKQIGDNACYVHVTADTTATYTGLVIKSPVYFVR
jgi:hypothetical protein